MIVTKVMAQRLAANDDVIQMRTEKPERNLPSKNDESIQMHVLCVNPGTQQSTR